MSFRKAYYMMRTGLKIKRKHWGGYWLWNRANKTIEMHTKDGKILDIRETDDVHFTISNIISGDWEVATPENCELLRGGIYE